MGTFISEHEGEHSLQALLCSKCPVKLSHTSTVLPLLHTLSKGKTTWKQNGSVPIKPLRRISVLGQLTGHWTDQLKWDKWNETICHMPKTPKSPPKVLTVQEVKLVIVSNCIQGSSAKKGTFKQLGIHTTNTFSTSYPGSWNCKGREWEPQSKTKDLETLNANNIKCLFTVCQISVAAGMCLTPSFPSVIPCSPAREGQSGPSSGPSAVAGTLAGSLGSGEVSLPG